MALGVEPTHRIADKTLKALKKSGLPATARNYELWYTHFEGRNPSLSREIEGVISSARGKLTQAEADELYGVHIQQSGLSHDVIDIVTRFKSEVADLHEMLEQSGSHANNHNQTLNGLSEQLRQTTEEFPAVGKLLEGVISVAREMRTQNDQLELRLAESVSEINILQHNVECIQAEALKDSLTGIANRSMFDNALEEHVSWATSADEPLALILADIDHFKSFNDKWGHQTGDQVLRLVAEVMNANVKGRDVLARYGGEEFAIILPSTTLENANMLANRIRTAVEARRLKKRKTEEDLGVITMSMGVSVVRKSDSPESLIERADECLYAAKKTGRNKVVDEQNLSTAQQQLQSGAA